MLQLRLASEAAGQAEALGLMFGEGLRVSALGSKIPIDSQFPGDSGIGDHATTIALYSAIVLGLYQREKTGKDTRVTTSLIAEGGWPVATSNRRCA